MHTPSDNQNDSGAGFAGDTNETIPAAPGPDAAGQAAEPSVVPPVSGYDELKAERDAYLDLARRERADFDNYRKRVEREREVMKRDSLAGFLKEFFAPLDDLDRVLVESAKEQSYESLATGVRIMEEKFWRVLAKSGVRKIDAVGKPFDPNLHEAMVTVPSTDSCRRAVRMTCPARGPDASTSMLPATSTVTSHPVTSPPSSGPSLTTSAPSTGSPRSSGRLVPTTTRRVCEMR